MAYYDGSVDGSSSEFSLANPPSSVIHFNENQVYCAQDDQPNDVYQHLMSNDSTLNLVSDTHFLTKPCARFPNERILVLSGNQLSNRLPADTLDVIITLQPLALIMDNNCMTCLPTEVCLPFVKHLSVQSQMDLNRSHESRWPALEELPDSVGNMKNLEELFLANNAMSRLPDSLAALHCLKIVDLRLNYLRTFPTALLRSSSITEINLNGNYLSELPSEIGDMHQLEALLLDNNDLTELPVSICNLTYLTTLYLRKNKLLRLPKKLYECRNLTKLALQDNLMEYPPQDLCNKGSSAIIEHLRRHSDTRKSTEDPEDEINEAKSGQMPWRGQILDFKKRQLKCLDEVLQKEALPGLDELDARNNDIKTIPRELSKYETLQTIRLDNNQIVEFPLKTLSKMKALKKVSLCRQMNNDRRTLTVIPPMVYRLTNLQELYLCNNSIKEIPADVCLMKSLRILDLDRNEIKHLPEDIVKLNQLEYLSLGNNKLKELPRNIGHLRQLRVLRLSRNKLRELPVSVCELVKLQTLSLKGNKLISLPQHFHRLQLLLINGVYETLNMRFKNACSLENNPDIKFPHLTIVNEGTAAIFEHLEFLQQNPEILNKELEAIEQYNPPPPKVTAQVHAEDTLNDVKPLREKLLSEVSMELGPEWNLLGSLLGLTQAALDGIKHDHRLCRDQAFAMLVKWKNATSPHSQKEHLVEALKKSKRNDLVQKVQTSV